MMQKNEENERKEIVFCVQDVVIYILTAFFIPYWINVAYTTYMYVCVYVYT